MTSIEEELWNLYHEIPLTEVALRLKALEMLNKMQLSAAKGKPASRDSSLSRALNEVNGTGKREPQ